MLNHKCYGNTTCCSTEVHSPRLKKWNILLHMKDAILGVTADFYLSSTLTMCGRARCCHGFMCMVIQARSIFGNG